MYRNDRNKLTESMPIEEYNQKKYTVDCVDFLLPWAGETFGASRREEVYSTLSVKLRESLMFQQMAQIRAEQIGFQKNIPATDVELTEQILEDAWKPFESYLELFNPKTHPKSQGVQRSGFGLGMGRLVQFLTGSTRVLVF